MKTFSKEFKIDAEAEDIYSALTNPVTIAIWSGYPAEMGNEPGSEFSLWEGDITGRILKLQPSKKIVQEWYFGEQQEQSIATIYIEQQQGRSLVTVEHTNIPDEDFANISEGWREYIMGAIQKFFNPNF